jgi:hypothetical protein
MAPKLDDNASEPCPRGASSGEDLPSVVSATVEFRFGFGAGKRPRIQDPFVSLALTTSGFGEGAGLIRGTTTTFHQSNRR